MGHVYPVTTALLTIRHILHGCNHRTTEMNGAQRVITLTESKEGCERRQTIERLCEKRSFILIFACIGQYLPLQDHNNAYKQGHPSV